MTIARVSYLAGVLGGLVACGMATAVQVTPVPVSSPLDGPFSSVGFHSLLAPVGGSTVGYAATPAAGPAFIWSATPAGVKLIATGSRNEAASSNGRWITWTEKSGAGYKIARQQLPAGAVSYLEMPTAGMTLVLRDGSRRVMPPLLIAEDDGTVAWTTLGVVSSPQRYFRWRMDGSVIKIGAINPQAAKEDPAILQGRSGPVKLFMQTRSNAGSSVNQFAVLRQGVNSLVFRTPPGAAFPQGITDTGIVILSGRRLLAFNPTTKLYRSLGSGAFFRAMPRSSVVLRVVSTRGRSEPGYGDRVVLTNARTGASGWNLRPGLRRGEKLTPFGDWSVTRRTFAYAIENSKGRATGVLVFDRAAKTQRRLNFVSAQQSFIDGVAISADGNWVTATIGNKIFIGRVSGGTLRPVTFAGVVRGAVSMSRDRSTLWLARNGQTGLNLVYAPVKSLGVDPVLSCPAGLTSC